MTHTRQAMSQSKAPAFIALAALALAVLTGTEARPWTEGLSGCWSVTQAILQSLPANAGSVPSE